MTATKFDNLWILYGPRFLNLFGGNVNAASILVTDLFFPSAINALTTNNKLTLTILKLKLAICQKSIVNEDSMTRGGPLQGKSVNCLKA